MKNRYKIYSFLVFIYLSTFSILAANEFTFNTSEIKIIDNGNIIEAKDGEAISLDGNIKILAEKFKYDKLNSILNASSNVTAILLPQNIKIKAKNIKYNENTLTFHATGNVSLKDLTNNFLIESQSIYFDNQNQNIQSNMETIIKDNLGNSFLTKSFLFNQKDNLIKINKSTLIDLEQNTYQLSNGFIDINAKKFIGKDISINFNNQYLDKNNEPRLKGNSISIDNNKTIVNKGIFTTCKKNGSCPPWQMSAKKITHDKNKKMIYYDDAWLKIYDKPVLYFPKFFHPDPTVKRQSGFLIPSLSDSSNLGISLNIPYYNVISNNKDFTLRPRFYSNEGVLLQSEYREINKNSNHILDFSFLKDKNHTKNHFFSKSGIALNLQNFDETELKLQLQHVSNDTYLKTHKLKSPIIGNNNVLTSSLEFQSYRDDLAFSTNFHIFEDLSLQNNDRFEFIYPSYTLRKTFDKEIDLDGLLSLNSSGYIKNYNTNVFEKVIINDLLFSTDPLNKSNGLRSNFDFLIKNINTDSNKSKKHKDETSVRLASLLQYNLSFPLLKKTENYTSNLKPQMTIKFSPNKTKNLKDDDVRLDISNIYTIDRIGSADDVEEGTSLTYGFEYMKTDNSNTKIISANIANVLRINESKNLPTQSGLGNKTSDVVGNFSYKPYDIFELEYDYSVDSNLNDINYQLITTNFTVNNFVTSFEYLNENKTNNNLTYLTNKTTYYVDESNNLSFEARENKKTGLTEFYNLIYQYRNDCLIAAIEYNKDYYNDRELKAEENVFFKLSIIPFGETSSANLLK